VEIEKKKRRKNNRNENIIKEATGEEDRVGDDQNFVEAKKREEGEMRRGEGEK